MRTHTHTDLQPRADSETEEVEVTLSVSKAINLSHLKWCECVSARVCAKKCVSMYACVDLCGQKPTV